MAQTIIQNGSVIMSSPENISCSIIFGNLTGKNITGKEYQNYLKMMFSTFLPLTYGKIELWEDNSCKLKGNINKQ